jgi:flagellar basal-body rod protein FlgB
MHLENRAAFFRTIDFFDSVGGIDGVKFLDIFASNPIIILKRIFYLTDTIDMTGLPAQFGNLSKAIQFVELDHRVISQNIANVNTPGYKTQSISGEEFQKWLGQSKPTDAIGDQVEIEEPSGLLERADGNNVDLDSQVSSLKRNAMMFQTFSNLLAAKMDTMKRAMGS